MIAKSGHVLVLVLYVLLLVGTSHSVHRRPIRRRVRLLDFLLPTTTPKLPTPPACTPSSGYNAASNWCYGTYCDNNGQAIHWDNFNCHTTQPTPAYPSTTVTTTLGGPVRPGCNYRGQYYAPGTRIDEGRDIGSNWCWVVLCDSTGAIIHGDDFNCFPTTTAPTTIPTTPSVPIVDVAGK